LEAKDYQDQYDSAEQECYSASCEYTKYMDNEAFKAKEEKYYD